MQFVVTLLSLGVTLAALAMLNLALIGGFIDNANTPSIAWSRVQLVDAVVMVWLGVIAALLIWIRPGAAETTLWLAAAAGVMGMAIEAGLLAISATEYMTPQVMLSCILVGGAAPAIAALSAALLTHRFVLHPLLASVG